MIFLMYVNLMSLKPDKCCKGQHCIQLSYIYHKVYRLKSAYCTIRLKKKNQNSKVYKTKNSDLLVHS